MWLKKYPKKYVPKEEVIAFRAKAAESYMLKNTICKKKRLYVRNLTVDNTI